MVSAQFESARVHPRRRPLLNTSLPSLAPEAESSSSKMQLKKGETFSTPTSPPANDRDPVLNIRSLPRRSPTSLDAIAASEQRMASILERLTLDDQPEEESFSTGKLDSLRSVDEANADSESAVSTATRPSSEDGYDLFPSDKKQQQREQEQEHGHESDSGLGSSISSSESVSDHTEKVNNDVHLGQSAITTSTSDFDQGSSPRRQLSYSACKQIERYLLVPILKEPKLKPFHPLVRSVPTRIVNKQIVCLRDLEKILLWLAPKFSASRSSYLSFCEFTIQCLHTSTSHLNARDQRLPADRPYTNGYFLDLVTQVRRYAAMIQANRQRVQAAQDAPAQSANKDEQSSLISSAALEGGLSQNGRPAELVIMQDGKLISMATGLPYEPAAPATFKRAMTLDQEADEGVMRSMARRKKNAPPMDINQKCAHCDKVFKRPCDLTKHEKTHSRPWKCTETDCKYHQIGWPTEKERDRHINDKHAASPIIFRCEFPPCTYHSKRESNCKQHMEKAHGWDYKRSKNNSRARGAKSKRGTSLQATPTTPSVSTPASGQTDSGTPSVGPTPSPYEAALEFPDPFDNLNFDFATPPESMHFNFATPPAPAQGSGVMPFLGTGVDYPTDFETTSQYQSSSTELNNNQSYQLSTEEMSSEQVLYDLNILQAQFAAGDPDSLIPQLDLRYATASVPSADSVPELAGPASVSHDGSPMVDIDWSNLNDQAVPGLSPGAQGGLMLYSPDSGLAGANVSNQFPYGLQQPMEDFTLYGGCVPQQHVMMDLHTQQVYDPLAQGDGQAAMMMD